MPVSQRLKDLSQAKESELQKLRGLDRMTNCCLAVNLRSSLALLKDSGFPILRVEICLRKV